MFQVLKRFSIGYVGVRMVWGMPVAPIPCSTSHLARKRGRGLSGAAPSPETKTRCGTPAPATASARFAPWRASL